MNCLVNAGCICYGNAPASYIKHNEKFILLVRIMFWQYKQFLFIIMQLLYI